MKSKPTARPSSNLAIKHWRAIGWILAIVDVLTLAWMTHEWSDLNQQGAKVMIVVLIVCLGVEQVLMILVIRLLAERERRDHALWLTFERSLPPSAFPDVSGASPESRVTAVLHTFESRLLRTREHAQRLYAATVSDDARTAKRLFDSVAQGLAGVLLELAALQPSLEQPARLRLEALRRAVSDFLDEVIALAASLYPLELERQGLNAALQQLGRRLSSSNGVHVDVDILPESGVASHSLERALYAIANEALGNALHHGSATKIELRLRSVGTMHVLEVRDNGRGFSPPQEGSPHVEGGLDRMGSLAEVFGGDVVVRSAAGDGASVIATLPRTLHINSPFR